MEGEEEARVAVASLVPKTPQRHPTNGSICDNFVLDVQATTFNVCKNCGQARAAHVDFSRASDELKGKLVKREATMRTSPTVCSTASVAAGSKACENFRRDLSGASFDSCVCGFPKTAHETKALTHGAGAELTRKLTKSKVTDPEPVDAAPGRSTGDRDCKCAGCVVS